MIYLSRLLLDPRQRAVQRDLIDCQGMHRTLLRAFPGIEHGDVDGGARATHGVLYRVDSGYDGRVEVLVQSRIQPDWTALPSPYLHDAVASSTPATTKEVGSVYGSLRTGQTLRFRLRANPTKRISTRNVGETEKWRGKRVELRREEDLLAWIHRKGQEYGFAVLSVQADAGVPDVQVARGAPTHGGRGVLSGAHRAGRLAFGSVLFDGNLRIIDHDQFLVGIDQGIGSGKAYGFGLLSIAPVPNGPERDT